MPPKLKYIELTYSELKRVHWPSFKEAIFTVLLVFIVVLAGGLALFALDEVAGGVVGAAIRLHALW